MLGVPTRLGRSDADRGAKCKRRVEAGGSGDLVGDQNLRQLLEQSRERWPTLLTPMLWAKIEDKATPDPTRRCCG